MQPFVEAIEWHACQNDTNILLKQLNAVYKVKPCWHQLLSSAGVGSCLQNKQPIPAGTGSISLAALSNAAETKEWRAKKKKMRKKKWRKHSEKLRQREPRAVADTQGETRPSPEARLCPHQQ